VRGGVAHVDVGHLSADYGVAVKALSGRQPWWWAILHAGKRIENRRWNTSHRGPILLHAAKGCTASEYISAVDWMLDAGVVEHETNVPSLADMQRGGIIGCARIVAVLPPGGQIRPRNGRYRMPEWWGDIDIRWRMADQYGWILADVEPLPFVSCRGHLGLFEVAP